MSSSSSSAPIADSGRALGANPGVAACERCGGVERSPVGVMFAAVAVLAICPVTGTAAPIVQSFTGVQVNVAGEFINAVPVAEAQQEFAPLFAGAQTIDVSIAFDDAQADTDPSPDTGTYTTGTLSVNIPELGLTATRSSNSMQISSFNDVSGTNDQFFAFTNGTDTFTSNVGLPNPTSFSALFFGNTTMLADDSLPSGPLDWNFGNVSFTFTGSNDTNRQVLLTFPPAATGPTAVDASWLGGDGDWSAANWDFDPAPDSATYPDNDAANTFNVAIGNGNVTLDVDATIDGLTVTDNRLTVDGGRTLMVSNSATAQTFGEIDVPTGGLLHFDGDLQQADAGSITFVNGELAATDYHLDAGFLLGTGTVTANLHVGNGVVGNDLAVVAPGSSPGTLTINGDVVFDVDGVLEVEIGGTLPGEEYDVFTVLGDLTLGGTLLFKFVHGFEPQAGQSFDFLSAAGALTGTFAEIRVTGLLPDFDFATVMQDGGLTLAALSDGVSVPAPTGLTMLLPALLFLGWRRTR